MKSWICLVILVIFGLNQKICGQVQSGQIPYPYYAQPSPSFNHGPTFPYNMAPYQYGMNPMYPPPQHGYFAPMPYPYSPYSNLPYPYTMPMPYPYPGQRQPSFIQPPIYTTNQKNSTNNTEIPSPSSAYYSKAPVSSNISPSLPRNVNNDKENRNAYAPEEVYEEYDFDGKLISAQTEFKPPQWNKNEPTVMLHSFPLPMINNFQNDFYRNYPIENKQIKVPPFIWYGKNTTFYQPEPIKGTSVVKGNSTTTIIANTVIKPNQKPVTTVQIFRDQNQNRPNLTVVNPEKNEVFVDTGLSNKNHLHSVNYNAFTTVKPSTTERATFPYGKGYSPTRWTTTTIPWYLRQAPETTTTPKPSTPLHIPILIKNNNNEDNGDDDYKDEEDEDDENSEEIEKKLFPNFVEPSTSTTRNFWFGK